MSAPKKETSILIILLTFLKVGAFTFGGGYGILPVVQQEVVKKRQWVSQEEFSDILIITQGMPGQLALNSSIQVGIKLRGTLGGIAAALGITTPSVIILIVVAAWLYPYVHDNAYLKAAFYGIRPAVVALIAAAAIKMGRHLLNDPKCIVLCLGLLFVAIIAGLHPILVLLAGGIFGLGLGWKGFKK